MRLFGPAIGRDPEAVVDLVMSLMAGVEAVTGEVAELQAAAGVGLAQQLASADERAAAGAGAPDGQAVRAGAAVGGRAMRAITTRWWRKV